MAQSLVTVFGGSGFLGRRVVERLVGAGSAVRVAVRHPAAAEFPGMAGTIEAVAADVRDGNAVARAVEGVAAVINAVGLYVEAGDLTFEAVHGEGAGTVARRARETGAGRLVHLSGIGAYAASRSSYVRSRARGEDAVCKAFPKATILRPSVMVGPGDALFSTIDAMTRVLPALPIFGGGRSRVQPVFVGDVAQAVERAHADDTAAGAIYELGGPRVYTYRELHGVLLAALGRKRMLLPLPFALAEALAGLLSVLPNPPLTRDQVILMESDNVVSSDAPGLEDLGVAPTPLEEVLAELDGKLRGSGP